MAVMLTDAGPLTALIDRRDVHFAICREVVAKNGLDTMVTTIPCVTEALFLLGHKVGSSAQDELLTWLESGFLEVADIGSADFGRLRLLMAKYADLPMAFADATLVLTAEKLGTKRIFTLDADFRIYRTELIDHFDIIP